LLLAAMLVAVVLDRGVARAEIVRVATYNVENYFERPVASRPAKSTAAKAKVSESILALKPDVLALQEIGGAIELAELRRSLKAGGLDLPFGELISGFDTNIHIGVLSRFALVASRPHTNETFLLAGRRFRVSRGFAEVDIRVNTNFAFTLIAAHLKSKRAIPEADEAELRLAEAKVLRQEIDACFSADPAVNLIVLGDLNDYKDSPPLRTILGRGKLKLTDTRPAERNGDERPQVPHPLEVHNITWTHHFVKEDLYSRIDYILLSSHMGGRWLPDETYVLSLPDWGLGSDHRPLVAAFETEIQQPR